MLPEMSCRTTDLRKTSKRDDYEARKCVFLRVFVDFSVCNLKPRFFYIFPILTSFE